MASKKLARSTSNKMLAGVCGGLGAYFDVDPTWIRILFVAFGLLSAGVVPLLLYLALWIIMPESADVEGGEALSENVAQMEEAAREAIEEGKEAVSSLGDEVSDAVSSAVSKATEGTDTKGDES